MKRFPLGLVILCLAATASFAQEKQSFSEQTRQVYKTIKANLLGAAEVMPEANYGFKPAPEEMTFGQWLAHVATSQTGYCSVLGGEMKRIDTSSKTSKADITAVLKASFEECDKYYDGLTDAKVLEMVKMGPEQIARGFVLSYNLTHDNECYGSVAVYLRIKGIVPPSTAARAAAMGGRGSSGR